MKSSFTSKERALVGALFVLLALAGVLPPLAQDPSYHQFVDTRAMWGIPRAMDVLSNVGFLAGGLLGLWATRVHRLGYLNDAMRHSGIVFFWGFVGTALGSAYYHLNPSDGGLAVDRYGMVVAFAGLLGLVAASRISERASHLLVASGLVLGTGAVAFWQSAGSLTPYALVQFGGLALVLAMLCAPTHAPEPAWGLLVVAYAVAKACEHWDAQVYELTCALVSGHTLKHVIAAAPAFVVTWGLRRRALRS